MQGSDSHWFLFVLFPFISMIMAIRGYKSAWAKNIVWAFIVFYGFTFAVGKESTDSDIIRYVEELREMYKKDFSVDQVVAFFKESGEADVVRTIIATIVSRFTDSPAVLTAVYGFIFGFFFTRNFWYVLERFTGRLKWVTILLLTVFFLINPFWNINGFRFNTAVHIFLYGLLPYLFEGKKKGLIICFSSVLVHFSFLFPILILLIYLAAGNRLYFYFGFFIISVFLSNISITELNNFLEANLSEVFLERSKTYRNEETVNEYRQVRDSDNEGASYVAPAEDSIVQNWYVVYYLPALYNGVSLILIVMFMFARSKLIANKWLLSAYCFGLLMFGFGNIMSSLPAGARFLMISCLISVAAILFYLQNQQHEKYVSKAILFAAPALLLYCLVSLRTGLYSISLTTVLGNPILAIFTNYNFSLNDLIK
ncbi:MAG: EpsG family protein [Bacteroidota bacterium]